MIGAVSSTARQMVVVALLLATVMGLFLAAQFGQRRLEEATARIELGAQRQHALIELTQLMRQAESSQRGYILVGKPEYLAPFQQAVTALTPAQQRLDWAFTGVGAVERAGVEQLKRLSDEKFDEMRATIEVFATRGRTAALQMIRTDAGAATMTEIDDLVAKIQGIETTEALNASRNWQLKRGLSVVTTGSALLACAGLLLLLSRLILRQLRSTKLEAELIAIRQGELERLIEQRTAELSELSTHLQSVAEQEKTALARELHDELGGLLVAARMDLSWLEERLGSDDAEVKGYFRRVQDALQSGFDIKRRVIESLRPTLLDNLGLIPALRWQVSESCTRAGLQYSERYPQDELLLTPEASIAVFRIVQEGLANVLKHAHASNVEVSIAIAPPWLIVRVQDDGVGVSLERLRAVRSHGLAAMRQRARSLGGQWSAQRLSAGGSRIEARLPLKSVMAESSAPAEIDVVRGQRSA